MKRTIITGILALVAGVAPHGAAGPAGGGPSRRRPLSRRQPDRAPSLRKKSRRCGGVDRPNSQDADGIIKAAEDVLTKFPDTNSRKEC